MISTLQRLPGNTLEITVTLPWPTIEATYQKIFEQLLNQVEVPGFRKGKAPKEVAAKQINKTRVYEEALKELIPQVYTDAVKEQNVTPIITPKVEALEADEGKEWKLKILTCEKPTIKLGNYKVAIRKLQEEKKQKIWIPGEKEEKKKEPEVTLGELLEALSKEMTVELSDLLVEQEVNRMLSNLINQTQKLGMTVEQYLQAQGRTSEQLRIEYTDQAKKTLSLEFALEEIADQEKVTVDQAEIEEFIKGAKSEDEKKAMESQRYYIGSLLRRQKTIAELLKQPVVAVK